ncbi:hypothetical protein BD414DRAFT_506546 [Trametes punicea]|nr:hypothetical protein BD414DRAFT_506546 [Trametes punicea]
MPNHFSLMWEYDGAPPIVDPEDEVGVHDLLDDSAITQRSSTERRGLLIAPYPNISAYLIGQWFWGEFNSQDLRGLNWKKIDHDLASTEPDNNLWGSTDGWKFSNVTIKVPLGKSSPPQDFTITGLAYRPLEEVIASVCASELSAGYHYAPYQKLWQPPAGPDGRVPPIEKVYGELYTLQAFLDTHLELQQSHPEPDCSLPRAVIACMPWSDSTHLAEYGNASLWPIYMLFGNQSKYERGRPSSHACHHVAYIPKEAISMVGSVHDMAAREQRICVDDRERRYKVNRARRSIGSKAVEDLLKAESLVPTINVFSERLSPLLPNFHSLFVPDLLHEWELGVWKNLMTYLIRILHAESASGVREFDCRYQYSGGILRRMSSNISEMKQMAARDYEDALQTFIPVIDRLLPTRHNTIILDLLFNTASLHALHKLRLHVDSTIGATDVFFRSFTSSLCHFKQVTCVAYHTTEFPKEVQARVRRQARSVAEGVSGVSGSISNTGPQATVSADKPVARRKDFSMNTYKIHSLGDYSTCIQSVGTMDSDTTQIGKLEHQFSKKRFSCTSKKAVTKQMTDIERQEIRLAHMSHQLSDPDITLVSLQEELSEGENIALAAHHYIGGSQKTYEYLPHFIRTHLGDPTIKACDGYPFSCPAIDDMLVRILYNSSNSLCCDASSNKKKVMNLRLGLWGLH